MYVAAITLGIIGLAWIGYAWRSLYRKPKPRFPIREHPLPRVRMNQRPEPLQRL